MISFTAAKTRIMARGTIVVHFPVGETPGICCKQMKTCDMT